MHIVYIIATIFALISCSDGQEIQKVFEELGSLNEQWLKATSFPEVALVLKHPPYSYHSKFVNRNGNYSQYFKQKYGNVSLAAGSKGGSKCAADLVHIVTNIKSSWALQMLDSDGKLSSGLLRGGLIWPGHFGECVSSYAPVDISGGGGFHGQYCVTSWKLDVSEEYKNLPLTIGLCIPDSCSGKYMEELLQDLEWTLERIPELQNLTNYVSLNTVSCKLTEKSFDTASIVYLTFISIFCCLSIFGTIIILYKKHQVSRLESQTVQGALAAENNESINKTPQETNYKKSYIPAQIIMEKELVDDPKAVLTANPELGSQIEERQEKPVAVDSVSVKIWKCFSIIDNGKKILDTKSTGDQLMSIHGIRFLSLSWVILGHTFITPISIIGNRKDVLADMDTFAFQMLLQSPLSVDSFFLLSGFLLAYLFLKEADKKNGKISWIYFYVHRFWRLTPAYMVIVFFYMLIFKYLGSGPFWEDQHCDASRGSWWKYLLYINNFIPINDMCVGWSWYLANDMQFYIISPLFLYPLWRWPIAGFSLLFSILLGTWVTTAALSYHYDLIPMFVGAVHAKDFAAYSERMWNSFDLIYDKPYCRIAPYIIGVALGYILYRLNNRKNFLSWWQQMIGWAVAAFCGLSVVFGLYHVEMSRTTSLFYNSLCRSSYSLSLAWLIFVCETGHGSFINKLLSWKFWVPLSRLTYCAYLIHPIFIHAYYLAFQAEMFFTEFTVVTSFLGFIIISYSVALLFSILFESPLMNLEKLVLKKAK